MGPLNVQAPMLLLILAWCSPPPLAWDDEFHSIQGVVWANKIYQLTDAGNVYARDPTARIVEAKLRLPGVASRIGPSVDGLQIALRDGRIGHLTDNTWTTSFTTPETVVWLGTFDDADYAVTAPVSIGGAPTLRIVNLTQNISFLIALPARAFARPSVALIDDGRLFIGWDQGEWGGAVTEVDLLRRTVAPGLFTPNLGDNVHDFVQTPDGITAVGGSALAFWAFVEHIETGDQIELGDPFGYPDTCLTTPEPPLTQVARTPEGFYATTDQNVWFTEDFVAWRWVASLQKEPLFDPTYPRDWPASPTDLHINPDGTWIVATRNDGFMGGDPDGNTWFDP